MTENEYIVVNPLANPLFIVFCGTWREFDRIPKQYSHVEDAHEMENIILDWARSKSYQVFRRML